MKQILARYLRGRVVVVGIGNTLRGDDGAGSVCAARLRGRTPWIVYDAEQAPENYLGKIVKDEPDSIILIDAADFGGAPGEIRMYPAEEFATVNFCTTHNASLTLTVQYLHEELQARIIIMAIQPVDTSFGAAISPAVEAAITRIEREFHETEESTR